MSKIAVPYETDVQNLYETLLQSAKRFPEKTALIDDEGQINYADFLKRVDQIADHLYFTLGIRPGDKIAIMQVNSIHFCCSFYAAVKIGAIAVMVNTKLQAPEIQYILSHTEASVLMISPKWWEKVSEILPETSVKQIVFDKKIEIPEICQSISFSDHLDRSDHYICHTETFRDMHCTAVIMFTSGTTGKPKGAMMSHYNLMQNLLSYADLLKMDEEEVVVVPIPLFHITGLGCILNLFVFLGATVVIMSTFDPFVVLEKIEQHKATHFHGVPMVFITLTKAMEVFKGNLSSLKTALCGGGFITHEAICALKKHIPGLDFRPVYGLTETSGAGVGFPCDYLTISKPASAGQVRSVAEVMILDGDGKELPSETAGEICFRGPSVIKQYYGMPELQDGILHTGDVGRFDQDGFLYIMDRIKDVVNRGGEKIFSLEVENVIMEIDEIRQVAVYGLPNEVYGEIVAAAIVLSENSILTKEQIHEFLKPRLAKYKIPQIIDFVSELPTNANNKVVKAALRRKYQEENPSIPTFC